jgi:hypothetical protein
VAGALKNMPKAKPKNKKIAPRKKRYNSKYDWEKIFSQARTRLKRGVHFEIGSGAMTQQIRQAASKAGVGVSLSEDGDTILVEVTRRA